MDREGSVVGRKVRVSKVAGELGDGEVAVVDLNVSTCAEVGGEDKRPGGVGEERHVGVIGVSCAVVDGNLRDAVGGPEGAVPAADGAVKGGKEKGSSSTVG
jgi:hypothetical protein